MSIATSDHGSSHSSVISPSPDISLSYWMNNPLNLDGSDITHIEDDLVPITNLECECFCRLFDSSLGLAPLPAYDVISVSHTCRSWYLQLIENLLARRGVDEATEAINAIYARFKIAATGTYEKDLRLNGTERGGKLENDMRFAYWYEDDLERLLYDIKSLQTFCTKADAWRMRERRAARGQWDEWQPTATRNITYSIEKALYKIPFEPSWHMMVRNGDKRLPPYLWATMLSIYTNAERSENGLPEKIRRAESKYPGISELAKQAIREGKSVLDQINLETSSETYEQDMAFEAWLENNPQARNIAAATRDALGNGGEFIDFGMQFATKIQRNDGSSN